MHKIYQLFIFLLLASGASAQGIHFEHGTVAEALAKAKAENKVLFIDGYAVWCGPCKKMTLTTFKDSAVGAYFDEHMVALKVDVEKGEGPDVKTRYGISSLPGYIFLDGDGNVVYRSGSFLPVDRFLKEVQIAVANAKDPQSVGRMAIRYEKEGNDPVFVKQYIDKLTESKSTGYTEIVERYLHLQKSMADTSKAMVYFLAEQMAELRYGGLADSIIEANYGSDQWKKYVRKDVREAFQKRGKAMRDNTTAYAIETKDTTYLELALRKAKEEGMRVSARTRKSLYTYYYREAGLGEEYKKVAREDIENYMASLNFEELQGYYSQWVADCAAGKPEAMSLKPHAIRHANNLITMASRFAVFAKTEAEKKECLAWAKYATDLAPNEVLPLSGYAKLLYYFGETEEGIHQMQKAVELEKEEGGEGLHLDGFISNLKSMQEGEQVSIE